jgi:hypothetical protein
MNGSGDYVDSWPTISGGRMLGHRVAFHPSRVTGSYGGFYGAAADTGRTFKITRDGKVWFKGAALLGSPYLIAFDGQTKLISGDPGGYVNLTWDSSKVNVWGEGAKQELEAATVDSRATYADAERRARELVAAGVAALTAARAPVAPALPVQSGGELINVYDQQDAARAAQALTDAATTPAKKKPRRPKSKPIPAWIWAVGGGAVLLIVGGAFLAGRKTGA